MQGWANIIGALGGQNSVSGAERYASGLITRSVPYAATARAIGTAQDASERTVERGKDVPPDVTIGQQVRAGLGVRSDLPVAQDAFGQPKPNQQQGAAAFAPKRQAAREDPVAQVFLDAGVTPSAPRTDITEYGTKITLTPSESRRWNELRGQEVMTAAQRVLDSGMLQGMTPARREERLKQIDADAAERATQSLRREIGIPEITRRRREAEAKAKAG
jgi:hypothetical protein